MLNVTSLREMQTKTTITPVRISLIKKREIKDGRKGEREEKGKKVLRVWKSQNP